MILLGHKKQKKFIVINHFDGYQTNAIITMVFCSSSFFVIVSHLCAKTFVFLFLQNLLLFVFDQNHYYHVCICDDYLCAINRMNKKKHKTVFIEHTIVRYMNEISSVFVIISLCSMLFVCFYIKKENKLTIKTFVSISNLSILL